MATKTPQLLGLYKTAEGRERLRAGFLTLIDRHMGLRKVAANVADDNHLQQPEEEDRTRSALRRWGLQGQEVLWFKDDEKTTRVLARLEGLLLSYADLRSSLLSQQEQGRRRSLSAGLQSFFGASFAGTGALPPIAEGLYTERRGVRGLWDDDAWLISFTTAFYRLDATRTFYLTDVFTYTLRPGQTVEISNRLTGFTHFTERGDLFRFLTDPEAPGKRRIDTLRRIPWEKDFMGMAPMEEPVFVTRQDELGAPAPGWDQNEYAKDRGMLSVTALDLWEHDKSRLIRAALHAEADD